MKTVSTIIIILSLAFAGCGKKEEPAAEAVAAAKAPEEQPVEKTMTPAETADSLVATGTEAVEKVVADVKKAVEAEMPKEAGDSMIKEAMGMATVAASSVDFSNMSWDKVSNVSFADKLKLASWATSQADTWKGKLTEAAAGQGLNMLSKMGDTGWQSSLKSVMTSINAVRESSPETYEMARGALVSAWTTFEKQASQFLAK